MPLRCSSSTDAIARQARVANGLLVLIGAALTAFVSRYFVVWLVFMGASLIFSGLTGFCGWAAIFRRMPWNRTATTEGDDVRLTKTLTKTAPVADDRGTSGPEPRGA
jgi:hypothetical protein